MARRDGPTESRGHEPPHLEVEPKSTGRLASPGGEEAALAPDGLAPLESDRIQPSFRSTALSGGAYLVFRELLGILIRVGGVIVVTRLIGPANYGIYAGASAFALLVTVASQMGIEVYLIRQPEEPTRELYDEAFTFLLVTSVTCSIIAAGVGAIVSIIIHLPTHELLIFYVLLLTIPANVLWAPAQARIERAFGYRRMAWLELGGDLILYAAAIPLAVVGAGAWSLVVGFAAWQAWLLLGSYHLADLRPRCRWSLPAMRRLLRHGIAYSSTSWVDGIAGMANPIVVGHFFGASGVGFVSLAFRLVDTLGFASRATWRLSIVALSRVQHERDRLRRGVEEGMVLQLLATAIPIVSFCVVATVVVPHVFGHRWTPILPIFTTFAVARIVSSPVLFTMGLLYSKGVNLAVTKATIANTIALFALAIPFTAHFGLWGFGLSRIVCITTWAALLGPAQRLVRHSYSDLVRWLAMLVPLAAFPVVDWPVRLVLTAPAVFVLALPSTRRRGQEYLSAGWNGIRNRGALT